MGSVTPISRRETDFPGDIRKAEWAALAADQFDRACTRGSIIGLPLHCEFCDEAAVWSTGDYSARVACHDLRHIAMAESIGSGVPPELLLAAVLVGLGQIARVPSMPVPRWPNRRGTAVICGCPVREVSRTLRWPTA